MSIQDEAPQDEPVAATAAEEDHSDPVVFRGEDADAPDAPVE